VVRDHRLAIVMLLSAAAVCATGAAAQDAPPACHVDTIGMVDRVDTAFAYVSRHAGSDVDSFRSAQARVVLERLGDLVSLDSGRTAGDNTMLVSDPNLLSLLVVIWFQVRNDGRLAGLAFEERSAWPALDRAIAVAVLRADSQRALHALPHSLVSQPIDLYIRVGFGRVDSVASVPVAVRRWSEIRLAEGSEQPPRLLRVGHPPQYPDRAIAAGIESSNIFEFVIDTTGLVEEQSIRLLNRTYREFFDESVRVLRSVRFEPARIGGCKVRVRVRQPISFQIMRGYPGVPTRGYRWP
jgi:TonB family protein